MSRIDKLIREFCPNGVRFKQLGEIGTIVRGTGLQKKDFTSEGVGCIHYGQIYTQYQKFTYHTKSFVSPELAKKLKKASTGDLIIATTSENDADVCKAVAWLGDEDIAISGDAMIFKHNENPKFISYLFDSQGFSDQKKKYITGTKVRRVSSHDLAKISLQIPPLEVQVEIVNILDKFTQIETELESELLTEMEMRRQQYDYYSNKLFTFSESAGIQWRALVDIADIGTGSSNTNEGLKSGKYPFFVRSQVIRYKNEYEFDETAVITSGDGVGVGKIFHFIEGKYALHQRAYRIHINSSVILPKFFFYYMRETFEKHILGSAVRSSVTSVRRPMLEKYLVPILPLEEQRKIIDTLDNYDKSLNEMLESLPTELQDRRKQFKYYHNKLFTFREVMA